MGGLAAEGLTDGLSGFPLCGGWWTEFPLNLHIECRVSPMNPLSLVCSGRKLHAIQPSSFSKTSCFPWGSDGFPERIPGQNGEVSPRAGSSYSGWLRNPISHDFETMARPSPEGRAGDFFWFPSRAGRDKAFEKLAIFGLSAGQFSAGGSLTNACDACGQHERTSTNPTTKIGTPKWAKWDFMVLTHSRMGSDSLFLRTPPLP